MKLKQYLVIPALTALTLGGVSCKKYLDRYPIDSNTTEDFFQNEQQIQLTLTGVYNAFGARTVSPGYNNPTPYYAKMDLYTEIGLERGLNGTIGSGAYNPLNGSVQELWGSFYQVVQRANTLLFNIVRAQATMTPQAYNRVRAEARVLRGLAYWHLVVYFGDVPFFMGPLTQDEYSAARRTPKGDIINTVIADLEDAANSLDWQPGEPGRVSRGVALGAAARLAMEARNYAKVISLTDNIIANGGYGLNPVFENLFRKNGQTSNVNREIMFYYPFGDNDGGSFNYLNLVQGSRNQGGQSSHFPTQFLVDLFECVDGLAIDQSPLYNPAQPTRNRDPRMKQTVIIPGDTVVVQGFTSMVFDPINRFLFSFNPTTRVITATSTANQDSANIFGPRLNGGGNLWRKYVQDRDVNGTAGNLYKVGWVYMRYAEMLLLNAEAKLESNQPAATVAAPINLVRRRAGMPDVSAATLANTAALRQLVRREKTVEFANEGIHMADLRRWDNGAYANRVMNTQIYGSALSPMSLVAGQGLVYNNPAPTPVFDPTYRVPVTYPNGDATRLKRELRVYNANQHNLCPIPQVELDRVPTLVQNPNW
jgi:hypothetical protein